MKTQNPIPAYVPTTRTPRAWTKGRNAAANLIRGIQRKKQPRPRWPAGSGDTTGLQHSADANRLWHSQLYFAWTHTIGPTERAAYEAAATTFSLLNNKGQHKTPNGFQLFLWWNSYTAYDTWGPPYPWVYYPDFWDDVPPDASWPKPVPRNIQLLDATPPTFTISWTNDTDLGNYFAFLQLTKATSPGNTTPTSHWQRLGPLNILPYQPELFAPHYTTTYAVPPWTSTPTYTPAGWHYTLPFLSPIDVAAMESIRAGISAQTYQIVASAAIGYQAIDEQMFTWGIDPATGARLQLVAQWIDPSTGLPYTDGIPRFCIYSYTTWTEGKTLASTPLPWPANLPGQQPYTITRDYTVDTVITPAGTISRGNGGSLPPTDCGLDGQGIYNPVPPHTPMAGTSFGTYSVYGPLHGWYSTAYYQAIIENPAKPGPRGLRLTLGANYEVNMLHSDWIQTTISL